MGKKKVLFTSHTANFSKFNRPFMRWLYDHGYEVHYASAGEEDVLDCDRHFTIPFNRSPWSLKNLAAYRQLKSIIDREDYALIHTHTPMGGVVTRLAARQARKNGTKVVYTAHGFHFYIGAPFKNWLLYYTVEKLLSGSTDCIITINEEDYNRAKKIMHDKKVYKIDGVGVDIKRFKPIAMSKKIELRKAFGFNNEDFILVYAAELNENKNQQFLISAMKSIQKKIPNAKLILCGSGLYEKKYESMIKSAGLKDSIKLMGYRNDLEKIFQLSDVCVASSIREGFGLNLIEAMSVGLPLIASNNRGHREIIKGEINGFLYDQDDTKAFIEKIYKIFIDDKLYKKISKYNRENADNYSVERAVTTMAEIYKKLI